MFYLYVNLILIILVYIFENIKEGNYLISRNKKLSKMFFLVSSFALLFIVSAFRGNFTTDYIHYTNLFHLYSSVPLTDIFNSGFTQENGYLLLSRLIGGLTSNEVVLFATISFITLFLYFKFFSKSKNYSWLCIFMFVNTGIYYSSFNISRQILAISISLIGMKYIVKQNFYKYLLIIFLASLFHTTSLIMLPMYFILRLNINRRNIIFQILVSLGIFFGFNVILPYVQNFFYDNYSEDAYGMTGFPLTSLTLPVFLTMLILINVNKIPSGDNKNNILLNSVIYYFLFSLLGLHLQLLTRLSYFFLGNVIMIFPIILNNKKNFWDKFYFLFIIIIFLLLYNLQSNWGTNYYFFWQ